MQPAFLILAEDMKKQKLFGTEDDYAHIIDRKHQYYKVPLLDL